MALQRGGERGQGMVEETACEAGRVHSTRRDAAAAVAGGTCAHMRSSGPATATGFCLPSRKAAAAVTAASRLFGLLTCSRHGSSAGSEQRPRAHAPAAPASSRVQATQAGPPWGSERRGWARHRTRGGACLQWGASGGRDVRRDACRLQAVGQAGKPPAAAIGLSEHPKRIPPARLQQTHM